MKPKNFQSIERKASANGAAARAIRYPDRWSKSRGRRFEQYLDWRHIARQVIQQNGGSFRLLSVLDEMMDLAGKAECWASDDDFARMFSNCSTKTISRDVKQLKLFGLILTESGWRSRGGKNVKARLIQLALPLDLQGIDLR